jgi:NTP pyrophosphatase (non-canonical NTP hydrolase)
VICSTCNKNEAQAGFKTCSPCLERKRVKGRVVPESINVGVKIGYATVIKFVKQTSGGTYYFKCDCGKEFSRGAADVRKSDKVSCGCKKYLGQKSHGKSKSLGYKVWAGMLSRCETPSSTGYPYYGGRGIKVCERWHTFENFIADMGAKPAPEYSLDRIDSDGNYEPLNCRWATPLEQQVNRKWRYMTIRAYQHKASKTAVYPHRGELGGLMYVILGLAGEAGEVAEKFKKLIRGDNGTELTADVRKEMIKEAGDVAWYLSQLAHELDISLEDIMRANLKKLEDRKKRKVLKGNGDNR